MSICKLVKLSAVTLLLAAMLSACGGGAERQQEYLNRAQSYYDEGNLDKAKIEVKNVLQINPNNARARYLSGLIDEANGNFRGAFASYSAAAQVGPKNVDARNKLAEFQLAARNFEEAEKMVNEALAIEPQNPESLALLSMIFAQQQNTDEAILKAQEALNLDPGNVKATGVLTTLYARDNPDLALEVISEGIKNQSKNESLKVLKLRLLIAQNKRDEAIALFKELIAEYPDKLLYTPQLVNYYLRDETITEDERKDLAEKTLRDQIELKPGEEQPRLWLAEFALRNRSREEARELLIADLKENPQFSEVRDALASLYIKDNDLAAAKSLYQTVINEDSSSVAAIKARNKLISLAAGQGDEDEVRRLLNDIFALDAENSEALITRAKLNLKDGKVDDAIPDLRVALKNDPESVEALLLLAASHRAKNEDDLALDNYQQLISFRPDNVNALVGAAQIMVKKNQSEDALGLLETAAKIDGKNPEVAKILTDLYSRDQRWDDALSASAQLIETENEKMLGYYLQGRVYLRMKEFQKALDMLTKSLQLEPSGVETLSAIAAAYNALDKPNEAINFVSAHVKKYPEHAHAKELLANLYAQQRDLDKAIAIAEQAVKENPKYPSAYTLLGRLYAANQQVDRIEALYKDGIKKGPEMLMLRVALAEVYQATKRPDAAIAQYEEVLKVNPNAVVVKNNLASLLLDKGDDPAVIQRAADLASDLAASDNPAFLDTAGWAQYKLGNYAQAVSLLAAAVENGGKGAVFHYHLGMAYLKSNLPAQAKEELMLALENKDVDFPGKDEAEAALQGL